MTASRNKDVPEPEPEPDNGILLFHVPAKPSAAQTDRRFGHQSLTHRPTGKDTSEQYIELIQSRPDLTPWACWQVAITEADRDRWKRMLYLTRQTAKRTGQIDSADEQVARQIISRKHAARSWQIAAVPDDDTADDTDE